MSIRSIHFSSRSKGPERVLSNFSPCTFPAPHDACRTVEHRYQSEKLSVMCADLSDVEAFAATARRASSAAAAKSAGSKRAYVDRYYNQAKRGVVVRLLRHSPAQQQQPSAACEGVTPDPVAAAALFEAVTGPVTKKRLQDDFDARIRRLWIPHSLAAMEAALRDKFSPDHNPAMADFLKSTGTAPLHEIGRGNGFWIKTGGDALGALLMKIRKDLCERDSEKE